MKVIDHNTLQEVLYEIHQQPPYRSQADKEMDYCDGNQIDTQTLQAMRDKGIPTVIENLLGPAMEDMSGMERKSRTDWRVEADSDEDEEADQVAKALSYKLSQAERRSGADKALTEVYGPLSKVGVGWIEVSRETDPFRFPYKVSHVHRNEIWRDWFCKKSDLSDARWLMRRRWVSTDSALSMFPKKQDLILQSSSGWGNVNDLVMLGNDSGASTELAQSWDIERGWSVEEQQWRDPNGKRVCLFQLLTRDYESAMILRLPNGRVVEFNKADPMHLLAVDQGFKLEKAPVSRINNTFFLGPHVLESGPSEFKRFNFVQFLGKTEDRTGVPYGVLRWLMSLQDEVNARISKMIWRLSATRTIRTDGAVKMKDSLFRQMIGRQDADIILDQKHMGMPGAKFEIDGNLDLNQQQYNRLLDLRQSIAHIAGVSAAMSGDAKPENAQAMSQAIEQSVQSQATTNDNHAYGRTQVGELLLEMIVKDMGKDPQSVTVKGNALKGTDIITLNTPVIDEVTGQEFLTNDVQRTILKVVLDEVPSTPSFRQQQLSALSEAFKSSPPEYQAIMMPHLMHLTNIPNKDDIVKAIRDINDQKNITEEQVQQRMQAAVDKAKVEWMVDQKNRDLDIKERESLAKIEKLVTEQVNNRIEAIYSAVQAAGQIVSMPAVVPVSDQVLRSAGGQDQDAPPIVAAPAGLSGEGLPTNQGTAEQPVQNTSPMFPPRVQEPDIKGIDEPAMEDLGKPSNGINRGIEAEGVQVS
jgi:hypothetical protein